MPAYLNATARPLVTATESAKLREVDHTLVARGQGAVFTDPDADSGVNYRKLALWDPDSEEADDGLTVWKPDAVDSGDPGRWVVFAANEALPFTLALRDGDGELPGSTASPDFAEPVLHVNHGGALPSTGLYGLSVEYTAGANRRGLFWDPANATWAAAQDTLGDDATISSYLPFRASTLTADAFAAPSGAAASGRVRLAQDDEVKARIGASTYRIAAALLVGGSVATAAFGSDSIAKVTVDADSDITIRSRTTDVYADVAAKFQVRDNSGASPIFEANVGGVYARVNGIFTVYNGGASVLDARGTEFVRAYGRLRLYDGTGVTLYFDATSAGVDHKGGALTNVLSVSNAAGGLTLSAGAGTLALDASGAATFGASTATSTAIGHGAITNTITGLSDFIRDGLNNTLTDGLRVRNTTAPTAGAGAVQVSPEFIHEGSARVSGATRVMRWRTHVLPRTDGGLDYVAQYNSDAAGAGSWGDAWSWTTATPNQFEPAFRVYQLAVGARIFWDGDFAVIEQKGSAGLRLVSRESTDHFDIECEALTSVDPIRLHASGETKTATQKIVAFGSGTTWAEASCVRGDGSYDGALWYVPTTTPKTAGYTATARELLFLDPTGGAFALTLPTAVGCKGKSIAAYMTALSANVVALNTTSGQTISGSASGALSLGNAVTLEVGVFTSDGANWWMARHAV